MVTADARTRRGEQTRRAILDEARVAIQESGQDVSLDMLAARLGLTKQAILDHFPARERVFVELAVEIVTEECEVAIAAVSGKQGRAALDAFVRELLRHYMANIAPFRLLYLRGQLVPDPLRWFDTEERAERLYPVTGRMFGVVEAAVRQGPSLPPGVDARSLVVTAHIASVGFATMYGLTEASGDPMKRGIGTYLDLMLHSWLEALWPAGRVRG